MWSAQLSFLVPILLTTDRKIVTNLYENESDPSHDQDRISRDHQHEYLAGSPYLAEEERGEGPGGEDDVQQDDSKQEDLGDGVQDDGQVQCCSVS